jgi:hypothetical protein
LGVSGQPGEGYRQAGSGSETGAVMNDMATIILAATLVCQAGVAAAQARCPTGDDLARGIRVDFSDGSYEIFRNPGMDIVVVDGVDPNGYAYQMELVHGLHLLSYVNVAGGVVDDQSAISYDYGVGASALPVPSAGGKWSSGVSVIDGFGQRSEPQSHVWGEVTMVDIGGCTYEMIEVVISYKTGDGYREALEYIPELGFGYLVWNESQMMEAVPVTAVSIAAVKK